MTIAMILALFAGAAADPAPAWFDAALCKPAYDFDEANRLYEAAEKIAKPDLSKLGVAIYKIPQPIGQDGFESDEVLFAGSAVGILVKGRKADDLAARYGLQRETSSLFGASTKGYARRLADADQPMPDMGKVSVVARESEALPDRTLLMCEFVSNEDAKALADMEEEMEKQR